MKTVGIIAEFNPFHKGHEYLIEQCREKTKANNVIIITSGNFVQRGMPAIINKYKRANLALNSGVDAIFELPCFYSTASAELFSTAAISFLSQLDIVDYLAFGCENINIDDLEKIAHYLCDEPEDYKKFLNNQLKKGISFPKARQNALVNCLGEYVLEIINKPNNILAIEYLKAINKLNSTIKPLPIKRIGSDYNSQSIDSNYPSASSLRTEWINSGIDSITTFLPKGCNELLNNKTLSLDDFSIALSVKLLNENDFTIYYGINKELSNRINNMKSSFVNITSFIKLLQSKNYTYSGISRCLIHILLNITTKDVNLLIDNNYYMYGKILGFRKNSSVLSYITKKSSIPIINKLSTYYKESNDLSKHFLDIEINSDRLYRSIYMNKYNEEIPDVFQEQIIIK